MSFEPIPACVPKSNHKDRVTVGAYNRNRACPRILISLGVNIWSAMGKPSRCEIFWGRNEDAGWMLLKPSKIGHMCVDPEKRRRTNSDTTRRAISFAGSDPWYSGESLKSVEVEFRHVKGGLMLRIPEVLQRKYPEADKSDFAQVREARKALGNQYGPDVTARLMGDPQRVPKRTSNGVEDARF